MAESRSSAGSQSDPAQELVELWRQGQQPDVAAFLARLGPQPAAQTAALLCIDQQERWQAGQRISAETYFQRYPELQADPDASVDLIYQEYLIRERLGEQPSLAEYQERFPAHAQMLQTQIEFHQAVQPNADPPTTSRQGTPAPRNSASSQGVERHTLLRAGDSRSESEVAELLRKRLLFIAAVTWVALAGYAAAFLPLFPVYDAALIFVLIFAVMSVLVVLLWRPGRQPLPQLRWLEVILFFSMGLYFAWVQFQFHRWGWLSRLAERDWQGVWLLARAFSFGWYALVVMYGVLIPNTWRRCAVVVGVMALCPVLANATIAYWDTAIAVRLHVLFVLECVTSMALAAALAIYGAHRIETLREQAAQARKLGPYQLKRLLGAGGMGEVYLAEHVLLRRPCALKIIRPERAAQPRDLARFEREVQATATLTHPNTVQVFDYGHADDGTFYYAMEYLPGLNLEELLAEAGPLPAGRAIALLRQVCQALHEAHAIGLIHRDIKPSNIIVGERGGLHDVAKLLDFGLVQAAQTLPDASRLTQEGDIAGTPAFMSPEQAASADNLDSRSDIYSLGALAHFLLTGQPPFTSASALKVLAAHLYEPPPLLADHRSDVPTELQAIVLRCLAKKPAERFADVQGLEKALADCPGVEPWSEAKATAWWRCRG
jgi:serine/threonine-protein kinase